MAQDIETIILMPELDKPTAKAELALTTGKTTRGIGSSAWVRFRENSRPSGFFFEVCGDFRSYLAVARGIAATAKNLNAQHANVFTADKVEEIKAAALAFYAKKATA